MRKLSFGIVACCLLAGMAMLVGCFSSSSDSTNPLAPSTALTAVTPSVGNASVRFNIQVTSDGTTQGAIRAAATGTTPQVSFTLLSIDPGSSAPIATYTQIVDVTNGSAQASFTVPTHSTIARIRILGGNIRGYQDFHGGADLVAGDNILTVCPVGSGFKQDLIARMMEQTVEQPTILRACPQNLAARVQMAINSIVSNAVQTTTGAASAATTLPQVNPQTFADAFNTFITQMQPTGMTRFTTDSSGNLQLASGSSGSRSLTATELFTGITLAGGVLPANMQMGPVFRPGIGGMGCVGYNDNAGLLSTLVQIDPANPANRFICQLPGRIFAVEFMPDGSIIVGGYHRGDNAPVLFRWLGNAAAALDVTAPTTDTPPAPTGISWLRHFGSLNGTAQAPGRIEAIDFDPGSNQVVVVIRRGTDIQIFHIDPLTGQNLAGFTGPAIPRFTPPPQVRIASPTGLLNVAIGSSINIVVEAIPGQGGTISEVSLYNGATRMPLTGTPGANNTFTFTWAQVPIGFYAITARADDNEGVVGVSNVVQISALPQGMRPPIVNITSPTPGTSFTAPANIDIAAEASSTDTISRVEFYNGPELVGTVNQPPYICKWSSVQPGFYMLTAKVITAQGAIDVSQPCGVMVNPPMPDYAVPPVVRITSPAMNQAFPTAPTDITITAEAVTGVAMPPTPAPMPPVYVNVKRSAKSGEATSRIRFIEFYRQIPPDMQRIGMTTVPYTNMPTVTGTGMTTGAMTGTAVGGTDTGTWAGGDPGMMPPVDWTTPPTTFVDPGMTLIGVASAPPYTVVWQQAPQGMYLITAVVRDEFGSAMPVDGVLIRVGNVTVPPVVDIVSPDVGSTITPGGQITLVASATSLNANGQITSVNFVLDEGRDLGAATLNAAGQWTLTRALPTDLYPGPHTFGAIALDSSNARMVSSPCFLIVMPTGTYTNTGTFTSTGTTTGTYTGINTGVITQIGTGYITGTTTGTPTGTYTSVNTYTNTMTGTYTNINTSTFTNTGTYTNINTATLTNTGTYTNINTSTYTNTTTGTGGLGMAQITSPVAPVSVTRGQRTAVQFVAQTSAVGATSMQFYTINPLAQEMALTGTGPTGMPLVNGQVQAYLDIPPLINYPTGTPIPIYVRAFNQAGGLVALSSQLMVTLQ